jgi:alanine dehydrogenase
VGQLSLGVMSRSRKKDERRLPIHPMHLRRLDADLRGRIYLEHGYGERFGITDDQVAPLVAGMRSRDQLIAETDVILLAKPMPQDLTELREGQVLWG